MEKCHCRYPECPAIREELKTLPKLAFLAGYVRPKMIPEGGKAITTMGIAIEKSGILRDACKDFSKVTIALWHYPDTCFDMDKQQLNATCPENPDAPAITDKYKLEIILREENDVSALKKPKGMGEEDKYLSAPARTPRQMIETMKLYSRGELFIASTAA